MAAELEIRLLGGIHLTLNQVSLTNFVSNKAPALLAYLVVTRRPHQRDALAALLWGELADADAKNNLRQALSNLRRLLDPFLLITRDTIALNPEASITLDVTAFEQRLHASDGLPVETRAAALQEVTALYHGDFLAGFVVRDAPEFEEWMLAQRSRFRELALHALHTLTQFHLARGNAASAIDTATRLLGIDSWREEAHQQLMLALARSGQRSAALAQYETCRRILEKELGVKPSAETAALVERIRAAKRRVQLPPPATPFVGRIDELTHITHLLADPTCRIITLLGPGGSGKTRLALEAAARAADVFLHGVCFVPLAAAGSLDVAPSAVAEALGVTLSGKADLHDQLLAYLGDKDLLLVLDNLEHLPGADEWVGGLAQACPEVRLLVTSRERLNLHGERLIEVSGLDVPAGTEGEAIAGYSATQLFLNNARAARADFALTVESESAVARICQLVEGLPLAIELAAAWVRHLNCGEIAEEIERNLGFLATTQKNVPARHRSLQAAFEHSWALLSGAERRAFARLSVFRGGCDREAALAITACDLPILAALGDKSLLRRDPAGRYAIHELLRQFAESKLRAEPQAFAEAQARQCAHYVGVLNEREDALNDARQSEARQKIAVEIDNIRAAWSWAVSEQRLAKLEPALESLRVFFEIAGWYTEGIALFGAAAEAERASGGDSPLFGRLLMRQAWFYHRLDRFDMARQLIQRCRAIFASAQPPLPAEEALCLQCLANMARAVGDFAQAIAHSRQSLALHRLAGNPRHIATLLNTLAVAHAEQGEYEEAERLHEEGLALRRAMGDRRGVATTLANLGFIGLGQSKFAETKTYEQEALGIFREIGYPMGVVVALNNLGVAQYRLGEHAEARPVLQECVALCQELGHRHIAAHALGNLGAVAGALGEFREGWQHIHAALQTARDMGSDSATIIVLLNAGTLLLSQSASAQAAEVFAFILAHPAANRETQTRATQLLAQLQEKMSADVLAAAQERGRAKSLEEVSADVTAFAVSVSDRP